MKIAAEVKLGHGIPAALPESDLLKLYGLLTLVKNGKGAQAVEDEALQQEAGAAEKQRVRPGDLREACRLLAQTVDVRPYL